MLKLIPDEDKKTDNIHNIQNSTLALEDVFKNLNWHDKGLNIDGVRLNLLRFADNIVLVSNSTDELRIMIEELHQTSQSIGLEMNLSKTKKFWWKSIIKYYRIHISGT